MEGERPGRGRCDGAVDRDGVTCCVVGSGAAEDHLVDLTAAGASGVRSPATCHDDVGAGPGPGTGALFVGPICGELDLEGRRVFLAGGEYLGEPVCCGENGRGLGSGCQLNVHVEKTVCAHKGDPDQEQGHQPTQPAQVCVG